MRLNKKVILKSLLIGSFFVSILYSTFYHERFESLKKWEPYTTHYKEYNKIIKSSNKERSDLLDKLDKGEIEVKTYVLQAKNIETNKKTSLKNYHKVKKEIKKQYSFLGYSSFHVFMYEFGRSYFSFGAVILLLVVIIKPSIIKNLKKTLLIGCLGMLYVSFFWFYYTLFIKSDFQMLSYHLSFIIMSIISTIVVISLLYVFTFLEKRKKKRQEDLKSIIDSGNELIKTFKTIV